MNTNTLEKRNGFFDTIGNHDLSERIKANNERIANDYLTEKQIVRDRHKSEKHFNLYCKTFFAEEIEKRIITKDTIIYFALHIARSICKANKNRSGNTFDNDLYISVCDYDYFNGNTRYYQFGEEILSIAVLSITEILDKYGDKVSLDDKTEDGKTIFSVIARPINSYIHKQKQKVSDVSISDALIQENLSYKLFERQNETETEKDVLTDIFSHIVLTDKQIKVLDYLTTHTPKETADNFSVSKQYINKVKNTLQDKVKKYCVENNLTVPVLDRLFTE